MTDPSLLLLYAIALPIAGAALIWALAPRGFGAVRQSALVTTVATLGVTGLLLYQHPSGGAFAITSLPWLSPGSGVDVRIEVGLDGLSLWMFGLTSLLSVLSVLLSWNTAKDRPALYFALLLLLEAAMLGVFAARDMLLFYIFFEFTLIPIFFLVGIWGGEQRRFAALKYFIYTLTGSLLAFLGLLAISLYVANSSPAGVITFSIPEITASLAANPLPQNVQMWIFLALFAGFALKTPLFPFHTWLPLIHSQTPNSGAVDVAGVVIKIGIYGFLRFSLPMLPDACAAAMPWVQTLAVAGVLFGALAALVQSDMKRLIAYSSVGHLAYCILGLFALNTLGIEGATLQMINYGITTGALFACVGMIYRRYHTREIALLGGVARQMPILSFFFVFFAMASLGLPGLNSFVGEIMLLAGTFQRATSGAPTGLVGPLLTIAVLATLGVVLGAWCLLWMVQRAIFGPVTAVPVDSGAKSGQKIGDLDLREIAILTPLAVLVVWIGVYPQFFLRPMHADIARIAAPCQEAVKKVYATNSPGEAVHDESSPSDMKSEDSRSDDAVPAGDPDSQDEVTPRQSPTVSEEPAPSPTTTP